MGLDDRDDGPGGSCSGHWFMVVGVVLLPTGAFVESRCPNCGAVVLEDPDLLLGRT